MAPLKPIAAVLAAIAVATTGLLYIVTPSGRDLPERVQAVATAAGVQVLSPDQVPTVMAQAMVAIEDERFYSHHGPDTFGLARAAWVDLTELCLCQGGSTLTQQLVDLTYYAGDNRVLRKAPSMALAFKVETFTPKRNILAEYLSIVPTGRGLTGARQAACTYFGHDLPQLTLSEAAEIAGMPQAPSAYDPRVDPTLALKRRGLVLDQMVALGYVDASTARAAQAQPVLGSSSGCS